MKVGNNSNKYHLVQFSKICTIWVLENHEKFEKIPIWLRIYRYDYAAPMCYLAITYTGAPLGIAGPVPQNTLYIVLLGKWGRKVFLVQNKKGSKDAFVNQGGD